MQLSSVDEFEQQTLNLFYKYLENPKDFQPLTKLCIITDENENVHIYNNCYLIRNGNYLFVNSKYSEDACYLLYDIEISGDLNITQIEQKEDGSICVINPYKMEDSEFKLQATSRGFKILKFKDFNNNECSLQESSIDGKCIWLGKEDQRMHLDQKTVENLLPHLKYFVDHGFLINRE